MSDDDKPQPPPPATPPARDMMWGGDGTGADIVSAGARKEKLRERALEKIEAERTARPVAATTPALRRAPKPRYAELRAASAFSFLNGSALPEDLVERAAAKEIPAMALVDVNGVYGAPRFWKAARAAGLEALVGAEAVLDEVALSPESDPHGPRGLVPPPPPPLYAGGPWPPPPRLTLLVESRAGYKNLCRLLTAGALRHAKGEAKVTWDDVAAHAEGLHVLTGGEESPLHRALTWEGPDAARRVLEKLTALFPGRVHVELSRHSLREEEHVNHALISLAASMRLPLVATNGVRYAKPEGKPLFDALSCLRHHTTLDEAGMLLHANRQRHVKGAEEMAALFADLPGAVAASADLADALNFTLEDLGYRFPDYPVPAGETPASYLRHLTWMRATARFRPLTARAQDQIVKELALIEKLELPGYFLIVQDLVDYCRRENILVQGRGSAANSAVCYALGITAIDPVRMDLLFERFLSEERGEWPDIDLDLPSGDQREKVIQYVYRRYGDRGAAMTANVISYRDRSAAREMAKVLGFSTEQVDVLAKTLGKWSFGEFREGKAPILPELEAAGFASEDSRIQHFARLFAEVQNLPRHLGQHSGGMVLAAGRLDEVVPLEPAAMEGRVVVTWDKDDCADLGIIKVDLLGLGMLGAIEEMLPTILETEGKIVDLAHLPQDDPKVYAMLNEADTVGVFQVESRAQMASLPRNAPRCFYDLVIQVAIIRPGPIVGGMVHPFFDRRQGREPVTYLHPSLEPILERTLGVPLFQEQLLKMAMVAAGFSGGEAEELRRAMGFKRSMERMGVIEQRLRDGMAKNGIDAAAQEQIVKSITSFALYGFPESHAASFALIAYASAWLKAHHHAAFTTGLLNAWPMGFYHPATLVKDAERHDTPVFPIDVNVSRWKCRVERGPDGRLGLRLGMRYVKGLSQKSGEAVERARGTVRYRDAQDVLRRTGIRADELEKLAWAGALSSCHGFTAKRLSRRTALWQAAEAARPAGALFDQVPLDPGVAPLPVMSAFAETVADYDATELTAGPHLMAHFRPALEARGVRTAGDLAKGKDGEWVKTAGAIIVRQRPGTAKGFVFLSLEDETGIIQAIVRPDLFRENRRVLVNSPALLVEGRLQTRDGTLSIKAEKFETVPLDPRVAFKNAGSPYSPPKERPGMGTVQTPPSHDFR